MSVSQSLVLSSRPKNILVIKRVNFDRVVYPFIEIITWLMKEDLTVYLEESVFSDPKLEKETLFQAIVKGTNSYKIITAKNKKQIELIITLGGDGTIIQANWLFQESIPPIMAFHFGTYGFLTPFEFFNFRDTIQNVFAGRLRLFRRNRITCKLLPKDSNTESYTVINEVAIRRDFLPHLRSVFDLSINGKSLTVRGDGIIVATPTGSTAYAANTGCSIVHPDVQAILISVSPLSQNAAWLSCDGRVNKKISVGDSVQITTCNSPLLAICNRNFTTDWFDSLINCMDWNIGVKNNISRIFGASYSRNDLRPENEDDDF